MVIKAKGRDWAGMQHMVEDHASDFGSHFANVIVEASVPMLFAELVVASFAEEHPIAAATTIAIHSAATEHENLSPVFSAHW